MIIKISEIKGHYNLHDKQQCIISGEPSNLWNQLHKHH